MYSFKLIKNDDIKIIIPFLKLLNNQIPEDVLSERLDEMISQGYLCVGIYDGEKLIGVSGLWIQTRYYIGKFIEPDNVIISPEYQGKGIGRNLMKWIYEFGKENGCIASELNCYKVNEGGQRFWESEGYNPIGIHYQKKF